MKELILSHQGASVILTNPALASSPAEEQWFDPLWWKNSGRVIGNAAGRGAVTIFQHNNTQWVLRHYQRGGLVGRFNQDRYLYTGHSRVRAVREFELLRQLVAWSLPTSAPLTARYQRVGPWYRADLITRFVPHEQTLAQWLADFEGQEDQLRPALSRVGAAVGQFQRRGVCHADLNCHNVLLGKDLVSIIDLDRGTLRGPGGWQEKTLSRLKRSAMKVSQPRHHPLLERCWSVLQADEIRARRSDPDR